MELGSTVIFFCVCGYYVKAEREEIELSPAGQHGSIQDFGPGGLSVVWGGLETRLHTNQVLEGDIQSAHPEQQSGSDECVAEPSHADNK